MAHDTVTITLIGGPTILLEIAGLRLLTDPTFDDPGSYERAGVVLTKTGRPALPVEALGHIDAVLLSHDQHYDNLDRAGHALLPTAGKVLTTAGGATRLEGAVEGLQPWQSVDLPIADGRVLRVTATPARHGPAGIEPISGEVIGFVLSLDADPARSIYISGDTVWYDQIAAVAQRFPARMIVLFTGAAAPRGPFHVTMDNNDAIEAAHAFSQATVIAIHNEGWVHFTQTQSDVARAFGVVGLSERLQLLEPGTAVSLTL